MKVVKVINNNIISSVDDKDREVVVMGRGLGFGIKPGMDIPEDKIEKIFRMESDDETKRLQELLTDVPLELVQLVNDIIGEAQGMIRAKLHRSVYITLIDHIHFALQRCRQNIMFHNPLLIDIRSFYPEEFEAGQMAVRRLNQAYEVEMTQDEAASVAMHLINAELGMDMPETMEMAKIVQNAAKIIKYQFHVDFNENSLNYCRFITHLKFFAQRIVKKKHLENEDGTLYDMVRKRYPKEYECACKIRAYIGHEYHEDVSDEELTYLTVHIKRITMPDEG